MTDLTERGEFRYLDAGVILGGPLESVKEWDQAFMQWSRLLKSAVKDQSGPLAVSFVFLVPGPVWSPDFAEPKITAFRKKLQQVEIQIPVPINVPEHPVEFLTLAVLDAINLIEEWANKRNRADDVQLVRKIVASL